MLMSELTVCVSEACVGGGNVFLVGGVVTGIQPHPPNQEQASDGVNLHPMTTHLLTWEGHGREHRRARPTGVDVSRLPQWLRVP